MPELRGRKICCPTLKTNKNNSIVLKLFVKNPIKKMPAPAITFASAARRLLHKKKKIAEMKTTRKPGASLGSSIIPLCKKEILNVSYKKLLREESTIPWAKL
jgi:hypothetical protein